MKELSAMTTLLMSILVSGFALAGPYAEKVAITADTTLMGQMVIKGSKVPDASVVGIPAYPGALVFQTRELGDMESNGQPYLPYIKLLSADPVEKVVEWYKTNLPAYFYQEVDFYGTYSHRFWKVKGDYGVMDIDAMGTNENVIISDGKQHNDDYPSAVSMIEVTYEPK